MTQDFKQGVAYLFELRKKQMAEYKRQQESKLSQKAPVADLQNRKSNDLFEDIPIPGDFGHGKFCICNDCRTKKS